MTPRSIAFAFLSAAAVAWMLRRGEAPAAAEPVAVEQDAREWIPEAPRVDAEPPSPKRAERLDVPRADAPILVDPDDEDCLRSLQLG